MQRHGMGRTSFHLPRDGETAAAAAVLSCGRSPAVPAHRCSGSSLLTRALPPPASRFLHFSKMQPCSGHCAAAPAKGDALWLSYGCGSSQQHRGSRLGSPHSTPHLRLAALGPGSAQHSILVRMLRNGKARWHFDPKSPF